MGLVSIIIPVSPAHNRDDILGRCLVSIANQTYPKNEMEVILIGDNCRPLCDLSSEGIKTIVHNFKHRVGAIKARNKALRLASGQFIAFLDADSVADRKWLENMVSGFKNDNIGACGGKTLTQENKCINRDFVYGKRYSLPFVGFGNAIFRKSALEKTGLLDEHLIIRIEDLDLSWRICAKSYHIEYVPSAIIYHKNNNRIKDAFLRGLGTKLLVRKYKRVLKLSHPLEIKNLIKNITHSLKDGFSVYEIAEHLLTLSGYLFGLIKEKLSLSPELRQPDLTDEFLEKAPTIIPLAETIGTKSLIKPNYILWWKTEDSCRIINLKNNEEYELEDVSAKMWMYIMEKNPKEKILEELTDEYEVKKDELDKDFDNFIQEACDSELLSLKI